MSGQGGEPTTWNSNLARLAPGGVKMTMGKGGSEGWKPWKKGRQDEMRWALCPARHTPRAVLGMKPPASAVTGAAEMQTARRLLRREVGGVDVGTGLICTMRYDAPRSSWSSGPGRSMRVGRAPTLSCGLDLDSRPSSTPRYGVFAQQRVPLARGTCLQS